MSQQIEIQKRFLAIVTQFTNELSLSYPELEKGVTAYMKRKDQIESFSPLASALKAPVAARDDSFFLKSGSKKGIEILPGIFFSAKLWSDTSKETRVVFWDYLASLILLNTMFSAGSSAPASSAAPAPAPASAPSVPTGTSEDDTEQTLPDFDDIMKEMATNFKSEEFKGIFENMKNMFKDLSGNIPPFAGSEGEGAEAGAEGDDKKPFEMPKIPEHLQNGLIAKIAAELAGEFKPEDLGIDPLLMERMNPMQIFEHLQFVYTNNPDLLTEAMKRVAGKIKDKFASGALNREALMREAKELMTYFTDNPAFKEMFDSMGGLFDNPFMSGGGDGAKGSQSERLRAARERLRKKAEKKSKK
jgi:hypothetical protein